MSVFTFWGEIFDWLYAHKLINDKSYYMPIHHKFNVDKRNQFSLPKSILSKYGIESGMNLIFLCMYKFIEIHTLENYHSILSVAGDFSALAEEVLRDI